MSKIVPGCLVSIGNMLDTGRWLGLVVDQKAGEEWAKQDPCLEFIKLDEKYGPVLVRVIGQRLVECPGFGSKSSLPRHEPQRAEFVRWAYIQTLPHAPRIVAGPDIDSIDRLLDCMLVARYVGMTDDRDIIEDLNIILACMRRNLKSPSELNEYERRFLAMLSEVLPQPADAVAPQAQ